MPENSPVTSEDDVQIVDETDVPTELTHRKATQTTEDDQPKSDENASDPEEEDEDEDISRMIGNAVLRDGTEKYVISVNGIPQCYTHTLIDATNRMWQFARLYKALQFDYNTYIKECNNPNNLQIIGSYKFYLISYNRTLAELTVRSCQEIEERTDLSKKAEAEYQEASARPSGLLSNILKRVY